MGIDSLLPDAWSMESWYPAKEDDVSGQCPAYSHLPALDTQYRFHGPSPAKQVTAMLLLLCSLTSSHH